MSDTEQTTPSSEPSRTRQATQELRAMATWKKVMLALSLLFVGVGVVLAVVEPAAAATTPVTDGSGGGQIPGGASFLPNQTPGQGGETVPATAEADPWSAGFFRLGFSFFAGFCIGYATRKTLKLLAFASGLALLLLFLLSYVELITVQWNSIDALFDKLVDRVSAESEKFRSFIMGSLPAAGLAGLGLYAGFRRN